MEKLRPLLWEAYEKIEWAKFNIGFAKSLVAKYISGGGISLNANQDAKTGLHSLDIQSRFLPIQLPLSIGSSLHSLRSALDTSVCKLLCLTTGKLSGQVNFPMHEEEHALRASFETTEQKCPKCGEVRARKGGNAILRAKLPDFEALIFDTFRPWRDGNFNLWALGRADNAHKHRMITPTLGAGSWTGSYEAYFPSGGVDINVMCGFGMPAGSSYPLVTGASRLVVSDGGVFAATIHFGDEPFIGKPVIETLEQLINMVSAIVDTLEERAQRCKLVAPFDAAAFGQPLPTGFDAV